jgi:hypothetical protein
MPTEHYHILRYTIRKGVKYFKHPLNQWPLAGKMTSRKNHEGPVISKIFTVLSSYKSSPPPPPPTPTIYTPLRCGSEVLFHLPDEFSSSMFQVTKTGEQSFNAHEEFCGCHPAGTFHLSFPISFLSTSLCILTQLFSAVHPFRIFCTFKKPAFQKEDGKDTNSKE